MKRSLLIALILMGFCASARTQVLINEIASEEPPAIGDWLELYAATDPADLSGWKIYEQNTLVKTFPSSGFTLSSGAFLILHFNSSLPDEMNQADDANGNGALDAYAADPGLTGTSNVITLRNGQDVLMDAVVFSDSSSWTSSQQAAFNLVVSSGHWNGIPDQGILSFFDSVNVAGGIGVGNSIGRNRFPEDSNSNADWSHYKGNQTPGYENPAVIACPKTRLTEGTISEVAPSLPISSGGDFIEFYIKNRENACGLKVFEGAGLIKTFPSVTPNAGPFGPFIVLRAGIKSGVTQPDETDASGDLNGNGAIDLYSDETSPGITGSSDNSVSLESPSGEIFDFIGLSDRLPLFGAEYLLAYDRAAAQGVWAPECSGEQDCYENGSLQWTNSTVKSVSRKAFHPGEPLTSRPASANDWEITTPTPGKGPEWTLSPGGNAVEFLRVSQSPFSPLGDGRYRQSLIHCSADENSKATIKIFDAAGRQIRTLAERESCHPPQTVPWDGKDAEGAMVPVGIYMVWMEIKNSEGDVHGEADVIIVGRRL